MKRHSKRLIPFLLLASTVLAARLLASDRDTVIDRSGANRAEREANEDCEAEKVAGIPDALAVANGVVVTRGEVDERIQESLLELREQLRALRERALYLEINSILLEQEAKRRDTTSVEILKQEVLSRVEPPTEAEALAFYEKNRKRLGSSFAALKEQILLRLTQQRQSEKAQELAERLRATADVKILVEDPDFPPSGAPDRPLARINGEELTLATLDRKLSSELHKNRERVHALRLQAVDVLINDTLLEQEARRRNVDIRALLRAEVGSKLEPVSEMALRRFYDQNRHRLEDIDYRTPEGRARIVHHLRQEEINEKTIAFAERLRRDAHIQVFLEAPVVPPGLISTVDQPTRGRPDAPVTIVEFIDYECPSCARLHEVLQELFTEYGDGVRIVSRDFPLSQHEHAWKAALAAEAAREQGKYWEYVRLLFENRTALEVERLKEYAGRLGLDQKAFDLALDTEKYADRIQRDQQEGRQIGVLSTPTVFINGRRAEKKTREYLVAAVERALRESAARSRAER